MKGKKKAGGKGTGGTAFEAEQQTGGERKERHQKGGRTRYREGSAASETETKPRWEEETIRKVEERRGGRREERRREEERSGKEGRREGK